MRLLLFSNSTNVGEDYLVYTLPVIRAFVPQTITKAVFIPYAGLSIGFDAYAKRVTEAFQTAKIEIVSLHTVTDTHRMVESAELIVVGGGNTFHLLKYLQDENLLPTLRERVLRGVPYIGWSAGSNLACPTLKTTNDMPIVEPVNFNALNLIPFQINPHYTDFKQEGHAGETREMRIHEFTLANREMYVLGLPEGNWIQVEQERYTVHGHAISKLFHYQEPIREIAPNSTLHFIGC